MKKINLFAVLFGVLVGATSCTTSRPSFFGAPGSYVVTLREGDGSGTFRTEGNKLWVSGTPYGYIRTTRKYSDFNLSVQWRWVGRATDGGIFVFLQDGDKVWPSGLQMQMAPSGLGVLMGGVPMEGVEAPNGFYRKPVISGSSHEKPVGKWNKTEIRCKDGHVTVLINGYKVNEAVCGVRSGYIGFQSEGGPMEFRHIRVE